MTALLVGGVGVANAVTSHLARKRDAIATMKTLGATGVDIFAIYCAQIMLVALFATLIGAALGAALPFVMASIFGALIPLPVAPSVHLPELMLSIAYGLLTALAFAAVAARTRPRHFGIDAVPRPGRRGADVGRGGPT